MHRRLRENAAKLGPTCQVETVGDCYVAVAGLPDPRKDHAVVMARFAYDCVNKMIKLVEILEVSLGPDTADLSYVLLLATA
jgi:Adenylate and Guanylate cyclase catalytic domain